MRAITHSRLSKITLQEFKNKIALQLAVPMCAGPTVTGMKQRIRKQ